MNMHITGVDIVELVLKDELFSPEECAQLIMAPFLNRPQDTGFFWGAALDGFQLAVKVLRAETSVPTFGDLQKLVHGGRAEFTARGKSAGLEEPITEDFFNQGDEQYHGVVTTMINALQCVFNGQCDMIVHVLATYVSWTEIVFDSDWEHTAAILGDHDARVQYIRNDYSFLEPGVGRAAEAANWSNRGEMLSSFRKAKAIMSKAGIASGVLARRNV